jgi:hypothetical protein
MAGGLKLLSYDPVRLSALGAAMLLGLGPAAWTETPIHYGRSSGASPPPPLTPTGENIVPSFFASRLWTTYKSDLPPTTDAREEQPSRART